MTESSDPFKSLADDIARFVEEREWDRFHDPKNLVMLLASEVGELAAEFRWVSNVDADQHAAGEARGRIQDEMADVAIGLIMLSRRIGSDLADSVRAKLKKNADRYPAKVSRGIAERPTRGGRVGIGELTSSSAVREALREFDAVGRDAFLTHYGFGRSREYFLRDDGKDYDSKAIVGAAYGFQYPERGPLKPKDFSGGEATVKAKLEELGFQVVVR